MRPDLEMSSYTRILLVPTGVQFRAVLERSYTLRSDLLARTIDLRNAEGLVEADSAWAQTSSRFVISEGCARNRRLEAAVTLA